MAEGVRFELTVPLGTSVFKTDAIDHSATLPILVEDRGIEPRYSPCKGDVFPLD